MNLIEFRGAARDEISGQTEYTDRGPVWVNPEHVSCVYDHTILIDGHKIRVMEPMEEIVSRIYRWWALKQTSNGGGAMND